MVSDIKMDTTKANNTAVGESLIDNVDAYQDSTPRKVISKKDLWICAFRGFFLEWNFNF